MKEILITSNPIKKFEQTYYSIDSNWFDYFNEFKVVPLPNDITRLKDFLDPAKASAIVLSGGGDILNNNLAKDGFDKNREKVEEFLIDFSIKNNIPVIGVCRGMQKIMTYLEKDVNFVNNKIAIKKEYQIKNLATVNDSSKSNRTCFNNYSIPSNKQIEKSWDILETDENSNLLCVKHHRYKILCFMWHPERDMTDFEIISTLLS